MARIGIYGGSFNPPHSGHVKAARELTALLRLDRLLVIPAGTPPHKQLPEGTPKPQERLTLCRLAFGALPNTEVSDLELTRSGVSYTVDTVKQLYAQYPDDELYLIMGTDMLLSFQNWYQPEEIVKYVTLAVMHRYAADEALDRTVDDTIEQLRQTLSARVVTVENHPLATSSTEVRTLIAFDCLQTLLPPQVAEVIREKGYYRHGTNWKSLPFEQLKQVSLSLHKPKRVPHAIGCCETAQRLARQYGETVENAARAGILHDVTKALGEQAQHLLCARYGLKLTESEQITPQLLHAKTGAAVAKYIFGENDAVCAAICWHTTGKANMSKLEKIIYLADFMEPTRAYTEAQILRALSQTDLDAACLEGFRLSLEVLRQRKSVIDFNSLQAWEYLAKERNQTV